MEKQDILETEIGTTEATTKLGPRHVKIIDIEVQEVGDKGNKKLVCISKHPDRDEAISISSIKHETKGVLKSVGLWVNVDEEKKIMKGSALAILMGVANVAKPADLKGLTLPTVEDEKGYLTFKAY